jgi:two-component system OmpR family response regulator
MKNPHVLLVDDDKAILELVGDFLASYDYTVSMAASGAEMEQVLKASPCDLVVLDLKLPDQDGLVLARRLRASSKIPIIMLTALGSDVDRIVGLEVGADDYLSKPFNPRELLARIRAVLRRVEGSRPAEPVIDPSHENFAFEGWVLDTTARQLISTNRELVDLTSGEFDLLEAFVHAPHRVLTRDQLLEMTRARDTDVFDRTIDVLILRLRRKLEPNPSHPRFIKTERGVGYVFAATVKPL